MDKFSLTVVTYLLLNVLFCQQKTFTWGYVCPSAVELIVSLKQNDGYEKLNPVHDTYSISSGNEFQVECKSRNPVNFNFEGLLLNLLTSSENNRITDIATNTSCHTVRITLSPGKSATGRYKCADSRNETVVYIYANGTQPPYLLEAGGSVEGIISGNRAVLPCITTNASVVIQLFKDEKDVTTSSFNKFLSYDPKEGFSFQISDPYSIDENYTCRVSNYDDPENVSVRLISGRNPDSIPNDNITYKIVDNEIICTGASYMVYFKCYSALECEFTRSCGIRPNTNVCGGKDSQNCFNLKNGNVNCQKIIKNPGENLGGLVFCSNQDRTFTKEFNLYTDFNDTTVPNLTMVSPEHFMHFTSVKYIWNMEGVEKYWLGQVEAIRCNASKFLFSRGIQLHYQFKDSNSSVKTATVLNYTEDISNRDYSLTSVVEFDDTNIKEIICRAQRIDSDEWNYLRQAITVREGLLLTMENPADETVKFGPDEWTTLNCTATALPVTEITWTKYEEENVPIPIPVNDHTIRRDDSTTVSILYVYKVNGSTTYTCNASNMFESKVKHYVVHVHVPEVWLGVLSYIVPIALIIPILMYFVLFCKRKRKEEDWKRKFRDYIVEYTTSDVLNLEISQGIRNVPEDGLAAIGPNNDIESKKYATLDDPSNDRNDIVAAMPSQNIYKREISSRSVELMEEVGSGSFGKVHKGRFKGTTKVAVKVIEITASSSEIREDPRLKAALKEIGILNFVTDFGSHENVIKFIGSVTRQIQTKIYIVVEYCEFHGCHDLKEFLKQNTYNRHPRPVHPLGAYSGYQAPTYEYTLVDLLKWTYQIACGMEFLAQNNVVHRDLAARNILLNTDGIAKVTDFGFSRAMLMGNNDDVYYKLLDTSQSQPLRWMAPETLTNPKFSVKTDVWAFGVTMWEIFTLGVRCPYDEEIPNSVKHLSEHLRDHLRQHILEQPIQADDNLYEIMKDCWKLVASDRPRFDELLLRLAELLKRN